MDISIFSLSTLTELITKLRNNEFECKAVKEFFLGEATVQIVNNNYKKIIVKNKEHSIKEVMIDCINDKVNAITLYGKLNISPSELLEKFKKYRETYSIRDELYFYFFNEDLIGEEYSFSFFKSDNSKIDFDVMHLDNLTIYFKKK